MLIYKGTMGFCMGVQRAIDIALSYRENKKVVYTLGKIIHNDIVVKSLEAIGVFSIDNINSIKKGDTVIIASHGAKKSDIDVIEKIGALIIDATCPFVEKIHKKVTEDSKNGYNIVIIGDENHTEVKGIASRCKDYQIIQDIKEMDFALSDKFSVVCQTTFPIEKYKAIKKNIANLATKLDKIVVFFDTICYTTVERQKEAAIIAKKSEIVLVLGDKKSSNTNKLVQIAKEECNSVYLISHISELQLVDLQKISKLGILSGASTPTELITEVINIMNENSTSGTVTIEDANTTNESAQIQAEEQKIEVKKETQDISMKEGLKKYGPKSYREGQRLKAKVVTADYNGVLVALESFGKNDTGFIDKDEVELSTEYNPDNYKSGQELDVIIIQKTEKNNKFINLSKKAYDELKIDDEKVKGILAGDEFKLTCTQEVKGGLLGKIGTYTVFVPASQIRLGFVKSLADYLNKPLRLKALPPKEEEEEGKKPRNPKRIVASQRIILEEEKMQREEEFWNSIPEGSVVNGKVKRFAAFGAFVSLKYMDALVHNSELCWSRKKINSPEEILELNKSYDFQVLSVDRENGKISLGYKQLQPKPEEIALTKYPVGSVVKGKVVRLVKFGAFVELEPGVDGLVHISQINHGWIKAANEALKVDDEVEVKVMGIENDRITLSIKELLPEEEMPATMTEAENETRKNDRTKKFDTYEKPERRGRKFKDDDFEPREYISSSSVVTLADLFNQNKE